MSELHDLAFPPGVFRNGTRYQNKQNWWDTQYIRWLGGAMRPVGGWLAIPGGDISTTTETIRTLYAWRSTTAKAHLAIGTNANVFEFTQGTTREITPVAGITAGDVDAELQFGLYGAGAYSPDNAPYGTGDPSQGALSEPGIWHFDNFGLYLVAVLPDDGKIWYWDGGAATKLVLTHATAPTGCRGVVVTPEGFLVALGADSDPRLVKWADQESVVEWDATAVGSTAGEWPLQSKGRIICGRRGTNETLIWTEDEMYAMRYIGGPLVYSIVQVGEKCAPIGPNAIVMRDGRAYWMGTRGFFMYDGFVQPVESDVHDAIFGDMNTTQRAKCFLHSLSAFGEIQIGWPDALSTEPNRYALWSTLEGHWSLGQLARTAAIDRGVFEYPIMAAVDGLIYDHERGWLRAGGVGAPYAESGPVEIGMGDRVISVVGLVPDEATQSGGQALGSIEATLYGALYPTATETSVGPLTLANPTDARITARQIRLRLDEIVAGDWRVGTLRVDALPGGRR
jgi:hypothetical protein